MANRRLQKKKKVPQKQLKRIHQLLPGANMSFTGSDRSIRDYGILKRKKELLDIGQSSLQIPLTAKPGMAQIDFGRSSFY